MKKVFRLNFKEQ